MTFLVSEFVSGASGVVNGASGVAIGASRVAIGASGVAIGASRVAIGVGPRNQIFEYLKYIMCQHSLMHWPTPGYFRKKLA